MPFKNDKRFFAKSTYIKKKKKERKKEKTFNKFKQF